MTQSAGQTAGIRETSVRLQERKEGRYYTMELLQVQQLCKVYGTGETAVKALQNVSFSMKRGEFAAVVGESGSGKSTLLNCIGALDTPTSGSVRMDGTDLFGMKENQRTLFRRRNIGFIFQSFHLIGELDVEQNMIFPLLLDHQKPKRERVEELLEILGLQDRRRHLPGQLSGGQQQRVAIGRAMIARPMLVLADEPTGNLDSKTSDNVVHLLQMTSQRFQQTIIMITHNPEIAQLTDQIIRIEDGRIVS